MEPIIAVFEAKGMNRTQYDQVMRDLEQAGASAPLGRRNHFAAQQETGFLVVDVWDSPAALEQFAGVLFPVLTKNGVAPPVPNVRPLYNHLDGTAI